MPQLPTLRRWGAIVGGVLVAGIVVVLLASAALTAFRPRAVPVTAVAPRPASAEPVEVLEVLSGDTVIVSVDHPSPGLPAQGTITARLIGIDSPNFGIVDECFAQDAQARLAELLPVGSIAWMRTDVQPQDDGGRWLSYLWASDGRFVNYLLTVDGFVRAEPMPPNDLLYSVIESGQSSAASRFGGLWGQCRG